MKIANGGKKVDVGNVFNPEKAMAYQRMTKDLLEPIVKTSISYREVLLKLGKRPAGGSQTHLKRVISNFGIDTTHFLGQRSGKIKTLPKKSADDILVLRTEGSRAQAYQLRRALMQSGVEYICSKCGQKPEWLGKPLTLDVDHVNENWLDDRKENLRFLCPNCHSQYSRKLI